MNATLPDLTITVTKTADGKSEYVQIMSADQFALNVVLIANKITIRDARPAKVSAEGTDGRGGKA